MVGGLEAVNQSVFLFVCYFANAKEEKLHTVESNTLKYFSFVMFFFFKAANLKFVFPVSLLVEQK